MDSSFSKLDKPTKVWETTRIRAQLNTTLETREEIRPVIILDNDIDSSDGDTVENLEFYP